MKRVPKIHLTCIVGILMYFSCSAFVHIDPPNTLARYSPAQIAKPSPFAGMSIAQFLDLTPKRYKELTGKKLSLPQKVTLKMAQYKVKRMVKKNKPVNLMVFASAIDGNDFHIPGFILGIVLGPIGILIAYLIEGKNSAMFQWALLGSLIWLGLFLLVVFIL
jgi:hypothetical protein